MSLLNKASLIQIPSGYKDGTLYSAKPTNGDGDFTFSRGSNLAATRVNSEGLIEKGRENLLLQSNSFDTTWAEAGSSGIVTSGFAGYDGTNDAWQLEHKGSQYTSLRQTLSSSGVQTYSLYAKAGTLDYIIVYAQSSVSPKTWFNLSNGTIGTQQGSTIDASIESVGNGWYRCSISFNDTLGGVRIYPNDGNGTYGTTSGTIYIQDAQLEQGLVATDYIETTTTTAQAGILEDMPRLDYSGGATCGSLLLEPQRSNHLTQSEYYSGGTWIKQSGTTVTQNTTDTLSPEGKYNASKVTSNGSNGLFHTSVYTAGGANTKSIYLKGVSGGEVVYLKDPYQTVSTTTCTLTTEWQRFTLSETQTSSASLWIDDIPSGGIYMWGAMLEAGSYSTSLIPTYGSSVTRSADSCSKTGISSLIGQTEGTIFIQASSDEGGFRTFSVCDGSTSNRFTIAFDSTSAIKCIPVFSGTVGSQLSTTYTSGINKVAITYGGSDYVLFVNGTKISTGVLGSFNSDLDKVEFAQGNGGNAFFGTSQQAILFTSKLTDDQLADLTTI